MIFKQCDFEFKIVLLICFVLSAVLKQFCVSGIKSVVIKRFRRICKNGASVFPKEVNLI